MLNCVDPASESSVLITTRIRKLIEGCAEVQLNLLTPAESVSLLLETGEVEASDAASEAAAQIAKVYCDTFCLFPSLTVIICCRRASTYVSSSQVVSSFFTIFVP